MTVVVKDKNQLLVPTSVQRRARIKKGDRLEFKVSPGSITITTVRAGGYKPTKTEWATIRKGEAAMARGESVSLTQFLQGLDRKRRKAGTKTSSKVPR